MSAEALAPWAGAGLRWSGRVAEAVGVLFATGIPHADASLDRWLLDLCADGEVLGADGGVVRIRALVEAIRAVRAADSEERRARGRVAWDAAHAVLSWTDAWRRELDRAILRATLVRGAPVEEEVVGRARVVVPVGAVVAGSRWVIHGRDQDDRPVLVFDDLREPELPHDVFNGPAISRLWQDRVVLRDVWSGAVRFGAAHPADESGGRVVIRPAFQSSPLARGEPWSAPASRPDGGPVRVAVVLTGEGPRTADGRTLVTSEIGRWNLEKLSRSTDRAVGWTVAGELLSLEVDGALRWIGVDPRAIPGKWPSVAPLPPRPELGTWVAARLGPPFAGASDPKAFERTFSGATRDVDPAAAAARALALRAAAKSGADEAIAFGVGMALAALRDDEPLAPEQILALEAASPPDRHPVAELPIPWLRRWALRVDPQGAAWVAELAGFSAELAG